jgi:hypothetical protein
MATPLGAQTTLCSRQTIGSLTYTTCTNGYSSVTQQIGDQQFLLDNTGRRAQTLRNGSFSYYSDNTGAMGTTQRSGSIEYLNIQSRTGTLRGTSQRIRRQERKLTLVSDPHTYENPGRYRIRLKLIHIFDVEVK